MNLVNLRATRLVAFCLAGVAGVSAWPAPVAASTTFLGHFDGNTGNSGLDADYAVGSTTAVNTGGQISTAGPRFGAGSLDGTPAGELSYSTAGNYNEDEGTVEMWFKTSNWASSTYGGFFSVYDTNSHDIRLYKDADNSIGFYQYDAPNFMGADSVPVAPADNVWHHLAWDYTVSGNRSTLYLDGVVIATTTSGLGTYGGTLPTEFEIGTLQGGTAQTFPGLIDEFRISDTALYGGVNFTPADAPFVVPEPASLSLIALGGLALIRRRK